MSEPIEFIDKIAYTILRNKHDDCCTKWEDFTDEQIERGRRAARNALRGMYELGAGMFVAGEMKIQAGNDAEAVWQAMIDVALNNESVRREIQEIMK